MAQTRTLLVVPSPAASLDLDTRELAEHYERAGVPQFEHGKLLIAALDPKPGERVLDVGTGTGRLAVYVAEKIAPHGQVVGIDPLPLRVGIAAAKKHPLFDSRIGRAEDLSAFADASFDIVYFNSVFHWVADKSRALAEAFRVLKPHGRLGLNSADAVRPHQSAALLRRAREAVGGTSSRYAQAGIPDAVSKAQMRRLVETAGFTAYAGATRTFVDQIASARDLLEWSRSSSFGNLLSDLDSTNEAALLTALARELESFRYGNGFRLERYLVFATARKPQHG